MAAEKILLGYGIFSVNNSPVGLTRGGGSFTVENEYREIEADGDFGPVEGRIALDRQVAKLTVNALEMFSATQFAQYFPTLTETTGKVASDLKIIAGNYVSVKWVGKTIDDKDVTIDITKALNMGDIELTLEDKDEVVPELEFTAVYAEASRTTPTWSIDFGMGA